MPNTLRHTIAIVTAGIAALPSAAWSALTTSNDLPEPDSLWLVGLALGVMIWFGWRSRR